MLVLASASPRRREMLARVGIPLEVRPADLDESGLPGEHPRAYVERIARAKAMAISGDTAGVVLAADTTVTIDDRILAKAADGAEAAAMLRALSGRTHQVLTAFAIASRPDPRSDSSANRSGPASISIAARGSLVSSVVTTEVEMIEMSEATIADYVACGEWRGKAGAYAVQGIAAALVREVRGSITNVIGLPLVEVLAALAPFGIVPRFADGIAQ